MDEKDFARLLAEAKAEIPSKIYNYVIGLLVVIMFFLAGTGVYFLMSMRADYEKNLEFYKTKIEGYDKQIAENNKKLEDMERQRQELMDDVKDYKDKYDKIAYNYANIINQINKPLPQPQQDEVFYKLGYRESWYQPDGGRKFSVGNTTKLQVELTERGQFKEQRDTLLLTNDTLNKVILNDLNQISTYKDNEAKFASKEDNYKKQIIDIQKDKRKEMYKKILISLGIGLVGGYAGAELSHH